METEHQKNVLICNRLLFELHILQKYLQHIIDYENNNILNAKKSLKHMRETLYDISNNLLQ